MSQFILCGPSIGASASTEVLSMDIQDWSPLGLTGLISLLSKGLLTFFPSTTVLKHQFSGIQPSLWSNSQIHTWLLGKAIALTIWTFVSKVMSLLFNTLSRFVIAFLPRSVLISWLQSLSAVILEPKKISVVILPSSLVWLNSMAESRFWKISWSLSLCNFLLEMLFL